MTMKINRHYHAVQSAFAYLTAALLQPSKTLVLKRFASLLVLFGMLAAGNVAAATYTWDGGNASGNWSQAGAGGNWSGGAAPASSTANALIFRINSNGQIANNDISNPCLVNSMTFSNGLPAFVLGGSGIEFGGTTPTLTMNSLNAVSIGNALTLDAALTLVKLASTGTLTFSQPISGAFAINLSSGVNVGTIAFTANGSTSSYSGFSMPNNCTVNLQVGMDDPFGSGGLNGAVGSSPGQTVTITVVNQSHSVSGPLTWRGNFLFSGNYNLTIHGQLFAAASARTMTCNVGTGDSSGPVLLFDNTVFYNTTANNYGFSIFNGTGRGQISGVLANPRSSLGFLKQGTGTWILTGLNTFTAGVNVQQGTLEFNSVENIGSATANAMGKPATGSEIIALGNTTTAVTLKYVGTSTLGHSTDRPLNLAGTTGGATVDASGKGPISFQGGVYATGLGNKTLTLQGTNTSNNTLGGTISNSTGYATSLVKDGVGTWLLTGANTYTGTTTVKGGKLLVNGSLDAGTSVTVTNAALGGTGTLDGNLTVQSSGLVAPGTSVGTLTNNLTGGKTAVFATGAKFTFELGAPGTSDGVAFAGLTGSQVTFNSNVIDFSNAGSWGAGTYTLFTFDASSAYTGTLVIGTGLESFDPTTHLVHNANNIQLVVVESASKPTVTIAKTADGAEEGPVNALFTVTRDTAGIANPVTVVYMVTGTATSGSDYTVLSGSVVIAANLTSAVITVPVLHDNDFTEGTQTVIVTLSTDPTYTVGTPNSATADIADGNKPEVSIVKTSDGAEAGPVNGIFIVSRTAGETTNYALTVNYTVDVSSTATSGDDYTALSGSVSIGIGQTSANIAVPVLQDSDFSEGTETVIVNLSTDAAYTVGTPSSATVNITDGTKPVVTLVKTTDGAEAGPVNGTFTVTRSSDNGTANPLLVNYTVDGSSTATSGIDYTALSGSVTIGVGQTNAIINVPVLQDILFAEGTETVILNLSANAGYTVGAPGIATVDITDGTQSVVNIVKTSDGSEVGPANGSFTISRSPESASSGPVTVYFTTNGSTATAGSDFTAFATTHVILEINVTNSTIQVKVIRDSLTEGAEGVQLNLIPNSGYTIGDFGSAIVSIEDDIPPGVGEKRDFTALYTFSNSVQGSVLDPTPPTYEKGIIFGSFAMVGGAKIGPNGIAGAFYASDWDVSDTNQVVDRYFEVTLTPVDKVEMTITNMSFDVARQNSGGTGPTRYAMRSSLDNYTTNLLTFTINPENANLSVTNGATLVIGGVDTGIGTWQTGGMLSLDNSFLEITNSVTFRVYGWNNSPDKDGGIDNFAIRGTWVLPAPRGTMISFQ